MITCENISFSYDVAPILENISLDFTDQKLHVLLGANGSGKSTLVHLMMRLEKLDVGKIKVNNRNVKQFSQKEYAKLISYVPQSANLSFDFTVFDIVLMGRYAHKNRFEKMFTSDYDLALQAIEQMNLTRYKDHLITQLSGGECQRVLIARALCQNTKHIILDEPIANLDLQHQLEVLQHLKKIAHSMGRCIVVVLHSLPLALHYADIVTLMHDGKILASGTPNDVLSRENILHCFHVNAQIERLENGQLELVPTYPQ